MTYIEKRTEYKIEKINLDYIDRRKFLEIKKIEDKDESISCFSCSEDLKELDCEKLSLANTNKGNRIICHECALEILEELNKENNQTNSFQNDIRNIDIVRTEDPLDNYRNFLFLEQIEHKFIKLGEYTYIITDIENDDFQNSNKGLFEKLGECLNCDIEYSNDYKKYVEYFISGEKDIELFENDSYKVKEVKKIEILELMSDYFFIFDKTNFKIYEAKSFDNLREELQEILNCEINIYDKDDIYLSEIFQHLGIDTE